MELEAVRLPDVEAEAEGEGDLGGGGGGLFGGGEEPVGGGGGGGLFGGADAGGGGLFASHNIDDDNILDEDDDIDEGQTSNNNSVKYKNARERGKGKVKNKKNKGQSGVSFTIPTGKITPIKAKDMVPSAKGIAKSINAPIKLSDNVLPQTSLMNDFIDRQITKFHGFEKTLDKMGLDLGIGSTAKNSILSENIEEFELDDDIIIDREIKGNSDGEDA